MTRRGLTLFELLLVASLAAVLAAVTVRFLSSYTKLASAVLPEAAAERAMTDARLRGASQPFLALSDRTAYDCGVRSWTFVAPDARGTARQRWSFEADGLVRERAPYPVSFGDEVERTVVLPGAQGQFRYLCRAAGATYAWGTPSGGDPRGCVAAEMTLVYGGGTDVFVYDPPAMRRMR